LGVPNAAEIVHVLRGAGLPIATAWSPFERQPPLRHRRRAGLAQPLAGHNRFRILPPDRRGALPTMPGMGTPKYMVVNDSIDITNLKEVVWALTTRNHPGPQGEVVFNEEGTNPLVAYLDGGEKMSLKTTKVIYNALDPDHLHGKLPKRVSFGHSYPPELQARVLRNRRAYGYQSRASSEHVPVQPPAEA
jgi:4-hydroxy-3-polyprenylbenzoate decarboxylase